MDKLPETYPYLPTSLIHNVIIKEEADIKTDVNLEFGNDEEMDEVTAEMTNSSFCCQFSGLECNSRAWHEVQDLGQDGSSDIAAASEQMTNNTKDKFVCDNCSKKYKKHIHEMHDHPKCCSFCEDRAKIQEQTKKFVCKASEIKYEKVIEVNCCCGPSDASPSTSQPNETKDSGEKRTRNIENWGKVKAKMLRNAGKSYTGRTGKTVASRKMAPPCKKTCILSCFKKFTEEYRNQLFTSYWAMGSLQLQRSFLCDCVEQLSLPYRRVTAQEPRRPNCAFYLKNSNTDKVRVCKAFLINTLGITERAIRTVIAAKLSGTKNALIEDKRGKHDNRKRANKKIVNLVRNPLLTVTMCNKVSPQQC